MSKGIGLFGQKMLMHEALSLSVDYTLRDIPERMITNIEAEVKSLTPGHFFSVPFGRTEVVEVNVMPVPHSSESHNCLRDAVHKSKRRPVNFFEQEALAYADGAQINALFMCMERLLEEPGHGQRGIRVGSLCLPGFGSVVSAKRHPLVPVLRIDRSQRNIASFTSSWQLLTFQTIMNMAKSSTRMAMPVVSMGS